MSSLLQSILDPKTNWLAAQHMKSLSTRLRKYGLRYDDLYDPYYDLDVKEALNRLPNEIVDARHQRLKRAMDLSMKHEYLSQDFQAMQTPFRSYLQDMLAFVKRERAEREALGESIVGFLYLFLNGIGMRGVHLWMSPSFESYVQGGMWNCLFPKASSSQACYLVKRFSELESWLLSSAVGGDGSLEDRVWLLWHEPKRDQRVYWVDWLGPISSGEGIRESPKKLGIK